jgi:hypothetical protein
VFVCLFNCFISIDVSDDDIDIDDNDAATHNDNNKQQHEKRIDDVKLTSEQVVTLIDAFVNSCTYNKQTTTTTRIIDTTNVFYTIGMYELDNNTTTRLGDIHTSMNVLSHLCAVKQLYTESECQEFGDAFNVYTHAAPIREVCWFLFCCCCFTLFAFSSNVYARF